MGSFGFEAAQAASTVSAGDTWYTFSVGTYNGDDSATSINGSSAKQLPIASCASTSPHFTYSSTGGSTFAITGGPIGMVGVITCVAETTAALGTGKQLQVEFLYGGAVVGTMTRGAALNGQDILVPLTLTLAQFGTPSTGANLGVRAYTDSTGTNIPLYWECNINYKVTN